MPPPVYRPNPALTGAISQGITPIGQGLAGTMMQIEAMRMQREQLRLQQEQVVAQRRLMEEQTRTQQLENQRREGEIRNASSAGEGPTYSPSDRATFEKWQKVAAPRMGRYPDFAEIAFAPDLVCSVQMIEIMANSPYAADIAYYLGNNKAKSLEIAQMSYFEQAAAIQQIEKKVAAQ